MLVTKVHNKFISFELETDGDEFWILQISAMIFEVRRVEAGRKNRSCGVLKASWRRLEACWGQLGAS